MMAHARTTRRPATLGLFPALLALLAAMATVSAAAAEDIDLWFTIEIGGQKAGWQRLTTTIADSEITTRTELRMTLRRGRDTTSIGFISEFVETDTGEPVQMRSENHSGKTPIITHYTFKADAIETVARSIPPNGEAGRSPPEQRSEAPLPEGSWLPPAAARQYLAQRLAAGASRITLRTMDPALGPQAITITRDVIEQTRAAVGPPKATRELDLWRCSVRQSIAEDLHTVESIDARGIAVITETRLGGLEMRIALSDQETAQRPAPPPEMLVSVFIRPTPPRQIAAPRELVEATYTLRTPQGALPELPTAGGQRFERLGDQSGRVRINSRTAQPAREVDEPLYLASSPLLDTSDEVIRRLTRRAVAAAGASAPARAEAMRRFVHQHVRTRNLDISFASASEVARTREGDCTEHAVLLAAMLRIEGIPARVVSGLIYAEQFAGERHIFGYHMWTQALLEIDGEKRWVDLDATIADRPFDAAHIAVATSDLGGAGAIDAMLVVGQLLGNLEISVNEAR